MMLLSVMPSITTKIPKANTDTIVLRMEFVISGKRQSHVAISWPHLVNTGEINAHSGFAVATDSVDGKGKSSAFPCVNVPYHRHEPVAITVVVDYQAIRGCG